MVWRRCVHTLYTYPEINYLTPISFNRKLAKIAKILLPWKGKYLSICGKIILMNSLVISQFTYLLMVLPTPSDLLLKLYEHKIYNFIWNSNRDKIKRVNLYNEYEFGGQKWLNIKALDLSLKASVIQKLYLNPNWFSSKLVGMSHPMFKKGLFPLYSDYT
jgi:hypothetical protein